MVVLLARNGGRAISVNWFKLARLQPAKLPTNKYIPIFTDSFDIGGYRYSNILNIEAPIINYSSNTI